MRKQAALLVLIVALFVPLAANAETMHGSFDVTGFVFPCPTHTYTITSGEIKIVFHESVDASGINHFTETETPNHVTLVDEDGNVYSLVGAIWFGGRADQILTATHMFTIVGSGGVSDTIRLVERFRNGQLISRDFGSCELP
ncbi:MAG: hypothetical protein LC808_19495 [Actinobacteria bacterium]|nr:hypothetical protein [Actinomycetota bacterium]